MAPQIPVTGAPSPLGIEAQRIDEENQPPTLDAVAPLSAGLQAGGAVVKQVQNIAEIEKATEFEALLQSGEQGMAAALKDAEAQGVDLTGVPDPKLYLRSPDDSARWYAMLAQKLKTHQTKVATTEGFQKLSSEEDESQIEGLGQLVGAGQIKAPEAAAEIRGIRKKKRLQEFVTSKVKVISDEFEAPDGAEVISVGGFVPVSANINTALKSSGAPDLPDDIRIAADAAAKKLNMPANILIGISGREASHARRPFDPASKNPDSSATGLGQHINATGKAMLKIAHAKGLIGKDVDLDSARLNPETSLILTGILFQENLKRFDGDVTKALLAHRLGPGRVEDFLAGKPIVIKIKGEDRDITADVKDWIGDVGSVADIVPGSKIASGIESDPNNPFSTVEGINKELLKLSGDVELSPEKFVQDRIKLLQKMKADLVKSQAKKETAAAKVKKGDFKAKATANSIRALIGFAKQAGPDGFLTGTFKKFVAAATKGTFFPDVKLLGDFTGGLAGQIAKGIGGESGRLTDQDRVFAMRMIPSNNDGKEVFFRKLQFLDAMAQTLERVDMTPEEKGRLLTDTIYKTAATFNKSQGKKSIFPEDQFLLEYKANPSDNLIRTFLIANSKLPSPQNVEAAKQKILNIGSPAKIEKPAGAATLGGDVITDTPEPTQGLGLDLPAFEKSTLQEP